MAYSDFEFPAVLADFGLTPESADLFAGAAAADLTPDFVERVRAGADLAAEMNTEKGRSEFAVAPVLFEVRRRLGRTFSIFSGVPFDVDRPRGLSGVCDFLLARSPVQIIVTAPVLCIVEAKNADIRAGLGQCIAEMVAAQEFNRRAGTPLATYGAVTTGTLWLFLRLRGAALATDTREWHVSDPAAIVGRLCHILTGAADAEA